MAFQARLPDRWKILPLLHHVRAVAREIDRSFVPHVNNVDRDSATDLIQINLNPSGSSKCSSELRTSFFDISSFARRIARASTRRGGAEGRGNLRGGKTREERPGGLRQARGRAAELERAAVATESDR